MYINIGSSRSFMFKNMCMLVVLTIVINISPAYAGLKSTINEGLVEYGLKDSSLSSLTFETIYPKSFYQKSEFTYALIGSAMVVGAAVTYFTAGAGAPAVASAASPLVVTIGGGSQGAYMAGLSTIGTLFGGNAVTGAAVVNGLAAGVGFGGTVGKATTIGSKIAFTMNMSASAYDGVILFENPETNKLEYVIELNIPQDLGQHSVRSIIDEISVYEEAIAESSDQKLTALKYKQRALSIEYGISLLKDYLKNESYSQEDLISLGILAYKNGEYDLFQKSINTLKEKYTDNLENNAFTDYLFAISLLMDGDSLKAKKALENSIAADRGAIEPVTLYINLLAEESFTINEPRILMYLKALEDDFDADDYATPYTLASVYYRLGTYYYLNEQYVSSIQYFQAARDNLTWYQKWNVLAGWFEQNLKDNIDISIANAMYKSGKVSASKRLMKDLIEAIDNEKKRSRYKSLYLGVM